MKSELKPRLLPESKYKTRPEACVFCQRKIALTFHHLIPRKMHRRTFFRKNYDKQQLAKGIWICRQCHSGLHKLYDEMTLAKQFNTLARLRDDPAIQKHVLWVAKQKSV